ncbi:MAG TPA: flavodoxin domain-containing protein, partial [Tichowtungia sp.]|nr:flavodoxin domain-containing protein [Tichowtungia sp.]
MSTQPSQGIDPQLVAQLNALAAGLNPTQQAWVGGYFTGLSAQGAGPALPGGAVAADPENTLTILYGSQTGHARSVAEELNEAAREANIAAELVSAGKFKEKNLKNIKYLLFIVSTQGEGDPPEDAIALWEYLTSNKAPKLNDLQFAVLALGDSSYEFYCKTGKDFDARFEELGGKRVLDRVDLDVDFDDGADAWIPKAVEAMKAIIPENSGPTAPAFGGDFGAPAREVHYSRKKPLRTKLLTCQKITGRNSQKDIRHLEIDIED